VLLDVPGAVAVERIGLEDGPCASPTPTIILSLGERIKRQGSVFI
jgi:hypothetical protein